MNRLAVTCLLALAGCGDGGAAQPADLSGAALDLTALAADLRAALDLTDPADLGPIADLGPMADLAPPTDLSGGYPRGPYGNQVGDTIAPLAWEGYVNPSAKGLAQNAPYGALAMNDLRLAGLGGKKYALLYAADPW